MCLQPGQWWLSVSLNYSFTVNVCVHVCVFVYVLLTLTDIVVHRDSMSDRVE